MRIASVRFLFAVVFALTVSLTAAADAQTTGLVTEPAPIYLRADAALTPLRTAAVGTTLNVLQDLGDWLQVEFQDPQHGRRIGWIRRAQVRVAAPHTTPMDLSVPTARTPGPPSQFRVAETGDTQAVAAAPAVPSRRLLERGWLDVNFGAAWSGAELATYVYLDTLYREPFALAAAYPEPSTGVSFDVGGGVMFSPWVGAGVTVEGAAHEDIVGLGATVPHPYFFDAAAMASGATDDALMRTEGAIHLQAVVNAYQGRRGRVRFFGGPTYFRYEADMVQNIDLEQIAFAFSRSQVVTVEGYESVTTEGTGWGWHVGGDASVFFTRVVGIGGFVRYSRGTLEIDEPLSEIPQDVTVGGLRVGGGLRLRF